MFRLQSTRALKEALKAAGSVREVAQFASRMPIAHAGARSHIQRRHYSGFVLSQLPIEPNMILEFLDKLFLSPELCILHVTHHLLTNGGKLSVFDSHSEKCGFLSECILELHVFRNNNISSFHNSSSISLTSLDKA